MEILVSQKEKELCLKYGLTISDLLKADVIILDGLLIKDCMNSLECESENFDLKDLVGSTRFIVIGCRTTNDKLRVYRNYAQ